MKCVLISDSHSYHRQGYGTLPECDLLIHAGDFSIRGERKVISDFADWLDEQPARHKIIIPGNHDLKIDTWQDVFSREGMHLLISQSIDLEGHRIYGSPWTPWFHEWAWNFPQDDDGTAAREEWAKIPDDVTILITHGPPAGILDMNREGTPCGCPYLADRVKSLNDLRLHVFGHIHEGYGMKENLESPEDNPVFANAAMIMVKDGSHYFKGPYNPPIVLDI